MKTLIIQLCLVLSLVACKPGGGGKSSSNSDALCNVAGGSQTGQMCGVTTPNPPDSTEFAVVSYDPEDGTSNFGVDEEVLILFSQPLNESSFIYNSGDNDIDNIFLTDETGEMVNIEVYIENDMLRVKPMFSLVPGRQYHLNIKTTITDMNSQNLIESLETSFLTESDGDPNNPGTEVMISFNDRVNEQANIPVDKYELHYGFYSRDGMGAAFKYDRQKNIFRSEADTYYVQDEDLYRFELTEPLDASMIYYFTLKACNSGGCSDYSDEAWKYIP
jgi:hypothetical protein